MSKENKYCCSDHVDMAFDDFLEENETFPYLIDVDNRKCTYCNKDAKYVLQLKL